MKRTILALAIAGLSVAAQASPPAGGGPPGPIDVTVKNVPLPVTEVPTYTAPDRLFFSGSGGGVVGTVEQKIPLTPTADDTLLQSYDVQAHVESAATSTCTVNAEIYDGNDAFVAALGRIVALPGRDAALSIQLPNVFVDAGRGMYVELTVNAPSNGLCFFDAQLRGVKIP